MAAIASGELDRLKAQYPDKFLPEDEVFAHIRRGDRIFLGTACGEPQHLVHALTDYVKAHPKAFFDAEIIQVWTLGVAPYTDEQLKSNFRLNSFFIGNNTRSAINSGLADYTPIFLSQVPDLFNRRVISIDIALVQTSLPDRHGFLSLGVSVDIVKAAVRRARAGHRAGQPADAARRGRRLPPRRRRGLRDPVRRAAARVPPERARRDRDDDRPVRRAHRRGRRHDPGRLRQRAERHHVGARPEEAPRRPHRAADRRARGPDPARRRSTTRARP